VFKTTALTNQLLTIHPRRLTTAPTLTCVVFLDGDQVEDAVRRQELWHEREDPVHDLTTSFASRPRRLNTSSPNLRHEETQQTMHPKSDVDLVYNKMPLIKCLFPTCLYIYRLKTF